MKVEVNGVVMSSPQWILDGSVWCMLAEKRVFFVVAQGIQAIKDFLFIREGQRVNVKGENQGEEYGVIFIEEASIDIGDLYQKIKEE